MSIRKWQLSAAVSALAAASPAFAEGLGTAETYDDVIIVSASPFEETAADVLTGVSVLSGDELARNLSGTLGETLRKEPGITTTSFAPGASRPIIRGQGGDRVRILTNGIGTFDASQTSPDHAVSVEPALAESIEIVRGVSLLRYGSSASGGLVNVFDNSLPSDVPEDGLEGAWRVGFSTVDDAEEAAAGVNKLLGEFGGISVVGHLSGTYRAAEDYDIPGFAESSILRAMEEEEHGDDDDDDDHDHEEEEEARDILENSFAESDSFAAGLSFIGENGFLAFAFKQSGAEYGLPGGHDHGHGHEEEHDDDDDDDHDHEEEHGEEEGGVFIDLDQTRFDVNGRLDFGSSPFEALQFFGGYVDYEHVEFEGPEEPGTVFTNQGYEVRAELLQRQKGNWRGATGVQWRSFEFSAEGEEAFVPETETRQLGLFTFQEIDRGPWHFDGSLRYENTEQTNQELSVEKDFDAISVALGAGYDFTENVKGGLTVFRSERAPNSTELFAFGPHLATGTFEIGDEDLDIETATGLEALLRFDGERGGIVFNAFYTDYQDYIYEADLGVTGADILMGLGVMDDEELEEAEELDAFAFVAEDATFVGFEVAGDLNLGTTKFFDWSTDAVFDYVQAEVDVTGNDHLPRIPPYGLTFGVNADGDLLSLRTEVEYVAEQDDVADFELPTEEYTLFNVYADAKPFADYPNVVVSAALLNISDEEARVHSSFVKDEVPLPGRNFRLSVSLNF